MTEKVNSGKRTAPQPSVATLPGTDGAKRNATVVTSKAEPPGKDVETSWEEVKDVFKSTTGNKSWMPGKPFTKAELAIFITEPVKQVNNSQIIGLKEVQKNIQELKATHTHGS